MRTSDALLLVIPDVADSHGILTGKLFEYLASEKQIICIGAHMGDAARIIKECNAGMTFERTETEALAAHLTRLFSQETLKTGNEHVQKYSRKNLTHELASIL